MHPVQQGNGFKSPAQQRAFARAGCAKATRAQQQQQQQRQMPRQHRAKGPCCAGPTIRDASAGVSSRRIPESIVSGEGAVTQNMALRLLRRIILSMRTPHSSGRNTMPPPPPPPPPALSNLASCIAKHIRISHKHFGLV